MIARVLTVLIGVTLARVLAASSADVPVLPGVGAAAGVLVGSCVVAEVVVTDIPRPLQAAFSRGGALVVLSQGLRGDAAAEVVTVELSGQLPLDGEVLPRVVVPFPDDARKTVLGSL